MPALLILAFVLHGVFALVLVGNLVYLRKRRPLAPSGRNPLPGLSVLIPARNEAPRLGGLLDDLKRQDHPAFEVVVVDDASTDGTGDLVLAARDDRFRLVRTEGPPAGWLGKPHALVRAASEARFDRFLFLDADVRLVGHDALSRMGGLFEASPARSVLTGLKRFEGSGLLLESQVPAAILTGLPWPLVRRFRHRSLAALNGQVWMIDAGEYRAHDPHAFCRNEILEDVQIGRYLKTRGLTPVLADLRDTVRVHMYDSLPEAWLGFRKNAYLIMGGRPAPFLALWVLFGIAFIVAPIVWPILFLSLFGLRFVSDRFMRFPIWLPLAGPVSYLLASLLQADSFVSHLGRRVTWKGRSVVD